jgi:predicted nuclease of restriction endonuclease-like RecB superfamily
MRMTEDELQALLSRNKSLKANFSVPPPNVKNKAKIKPNINTIQPKKEFDSLAEEKYYNEYLYPLILAKEIESVELHKSFEILSSINQAGIKLRAKVYAPDFIIHYPNGSVKVVEIKGKIVKKLQRDYQLRKHLFIEKFVIPNGWKFEEVIAEDITGS